MASDGLRRRVERARAALDALRPAQALAGPTLAELGDPRLVELTALLTQQDWLDEVEEREALGPFLRGEADLPDPSRLHHPAYQHSGVRRMPMAWQLQAAREVAERYVRARRRYNLTRQSPPTAPVVDVAANGHRRSEGRR
jgi:hypothetical protein